MEPQHAIKAFITGKVKHPEEELANKGGVVAAVSMPRGQSFVICITHTAGIRDIGHM